MSLNPYTKEPVDLSKDYTKALVELQAAAWTLLRVIDYGWPGTVMWCIAVEDLRGAYEDVCLAAPQFGKFPESHWTVPKMLDDLVEEAKEAGGCLTDNG